MRFSIIHMALWLAMVASSLATDAHEAVRCVMYLTGQHVVVPSDSHLVDSITHVILAFMRSDVFNVDKTPAEFPLFTSVAETREKFNANTRSWSQLAVGETQDLKKLRVMIHRESGGLAT